MVCFGWSKDDGIVSQEHVNHYEALAKGGAGLIVVEATCVTKSGRLADTQLGIWSDEHILGLKKIADVCHRHQAVVLIQIHHAGFKTPPSVTQSPMAPSEYKGARALTFDEIQGIKEDFIAAALRAKEAGFDGVELHGAHGYLISQFLSPVINKRNDMYGGSFSAMMEFPRQIIKGIKEKTGKDFILACRMGCNEPDYEEGIEIAREYEKLGVDLLHVSAGIPGQELPKAPEDFEYNWIVYGGTLIKQNVNIPVIVVNDIRTPQRAEYLIENNLADFAAIGKGHLVDPEWSLKAQSNLEIISCIKCPKCQWFVDGKHCPRYREIG